MCFSPQSPPVWTSTLNKELLSLREQKETAVRFPQHLPLTDYFVCFVGFSQISLYVSLLLFPASVFFFIFCFLCFPQHCSHSSSPPSTSSLSHMSSPLFSSRTMRVSCRPCRSRLRPAPLLQRQRKRRKKRKKVKSGDGNFLLYSFWFCTIRLAFHL